MDYMDQLVILCIRMFLLSLRLFFPILYNLYFVFEHFSQFLDSNIKIQELAKALQGNPAVPGSKKVPNDAV